MKSTLKNVKLTKEDSDALMQKCRLVGHEFVYSAIRTYENGTIDDVLCWREGNITFQATIENIEGPIFTNIVQRDKF